MLYPFKMSHNQLLGMAEAHGVKSKRSILRDMRTFAALRRRGYIDHTGKPTKTGYHTAMLALSYRGNNG